MATHQSGVCLQRHLKVLFVELLKRNKESFTVQLSLIDLFVKNSRRSLDMMRRVSSDTRHSLTKKILALVGASIECRAQGGEFCNDVT